MSLEEAEGKSWGAAPSDATKMIATIYDLRRKPLAALGPEDLRLLLSQQVSVEVLIPRTLRLLAADPLIEGDYYPGDVLVALLKAPAEYWSTHPNQLHKVNEILERVGDDDVDAETRRSIHNFRLKTGGLA